MLYSGAFLGHFIEYALLGLGVLSLYGARGEALRQGTGFKAFQKAKISPQDTQLNTISCIFSQKFKLNTNVLSVHSKRRPNISFQDRLWLNAGQKYCRML